MKTKEESIRYYILTHIDFDGYNEIERIDSYKELLQTLMHIFWEYGEERIKLGYSMRETFISFCGGLPSCFSIDFETHKQRELLKRWRVRISGYTDDDISDLFYGTIFETLIRWEGKAWKIKD